MELTHHDDPEYTTVRQTADILQVCDRTLRRLRQRGTVPQPVRLGGKLLYTREQRQAIKRALHVQAGFVA